MISAMLQYIQRSPDCFHAVEELRQRLLQEGYTELRRPVAADSRGEVLHHQERLLHDGLPPPAGGPCRLPADRQPFRLPCFRLRDHAELMGSISACPPSATAA